MTAAPIDAEEPLPSAVLFDMDGLLVDSEPLWFIAETEVMASIGASWSEDEQHLMLGGPVERVVSYMNEKAGGGHDETELLRRLHAAMERLVGAEPVHWRPGAKQLLLDLEDAGVPCALVSASWRALVDGVTDAVLHEVGHSVFVTSVAGDEVERTKPFPDPYLLAAARLGVAIEDCVVLEDSPTGTQAGIASGACVVAVPSLVDIEPREGLRIVASLADLTPSLLGAWSQEWADARRG